MVSNQVAVIAVGLGCMAAAAGGGYLAMRQNTVPTPAAAVAPVSAPAAPAATTATSRPVRETPAAVEAPVPTPAPKAAPAPASRVATPSRAPVVKREEISARAVSPPRSAAPLSAQNSAPAPERTLPHAFALPAQSGAALPARRAAAGPARAPTNRGDHHDGATPGRARHSGTAARTRAAAEIAAGARRLGELGDRTADGNARFRAKRLASRTGSRRASRAT